MTIVESLPVPLHFRSCLLAEDAQLQKHDHFISINSSEFLVLHSPGCKLIQRSFTPNDGGRVIRKGLCPIHSHATQFDFQNASIHGRTLFVQCCQNHEPRHWLICDLRTGAVLALQLPRFKIWLETFAADERGMLNLERHSDNYTLSYVTLPLAAAAADTGTHAPITQLNQLPSTPLLHLSIPCNTLTFGADYYAVEYRCAYSARHSLIIESHLAAEGPEKNEYEVTCVHVISAQQKLTLADIPEYTPLATLPGQIAFLSDDWVVTTEQNLGYRPVYYFFDFARMRRTSHPYKSNFEKLRSARCRTSRSDQR